MSDKEKCKQEQLQALELLDKLDRIPIELLEGLPKLYKDVNDIKVDLDDVKTNVIEPIEKVLKHVKKLPWVIVALMATGADWDTIKNLIELVGATQ